MDAFGEKEGCVVHYGGSIAFRAFEEARRCYLYGEFIAVVLLCQIVFEHTLAGLFQMEGRDDLERAGFKQLLNEALQARYISQQEYDAFDAIRRLRNPYVHYRPPTKKRQGHPEVYPEWIGRRMVESNMTDFEIFEIDAQVALKAVFRLFDRRPFQFEDSR